jgi:hypothetical protein
MLSFASSGALVGRTSGFGYAIPTRIDPLRSIRNSGEVSAHTTRDGLDLIIRVIVIGNEGLAHLKILRTIPTREHPVQQ